MEMSFSVFFNCQMYEIIISLTYKPTNQNRLNFNYKFQLATFSNEASKWF
jgi:hypothetical protein